MKLDYKQTIKVGIAFAIIMLFWTAYDFVIPLLLENAFGLSNTVRGVVMGIDNLLSLFMLPLFGKISDKSTNRMGKRKPFILFGTIAAVVIMIFVPISAGTQLREAAELRSDIYTVGITDITYSYTASDGTVYDAEGLYTMMYETKAASGVGYKYSDHNYLKLNNIGTLQKYLNVAQGGLNEISEKDGKYYVTDYLSVDNETQEIKTEITAEQYESYKTQNSNYERFVVPGLEAFASEEVNNIITRENPARLGVYLAILLMVLIAMATFRSPAVALMPDVTPKPLRSQGNAIINLVGGVGAALAFLVYTITLTVSESAYVQIFGCCAAVMVVLLVVFMLLVDENKMNKACRELCAQYGISNDDEPVEMEIIGLHHKEGESEEDEALVNAQNKAAADTAAEHHRKLQRAKKRSFFLILASIFMWFMGYNAISSNLSIYCTKVLNQSASVASIISGASMVVSAIAFIPVGFMAVKLGRRRSIIIGFALAIISFVLIFLFVKPDNMAKFLFGAFYLIAGFGLIIANVNTFPMVLELSKSGDVGKYTGYYYTATMSAQAITPFVAGVVMDYMTDRYLFLYSGFCVIIASVLMFFVRHGDSKPIPAKSAIEYIGAGDD